MNNYLIVNYEWDTTRVWRNRCAGRFYLADNANLEVDSCYLYSGITLHVNNGATLKLGNCYLNYDCKIICFHKIIIGNDVVISENVTIRDSDNHTIMKDGYEKSLPVIIEDKVWIGLGAIILKGVCIGTGSVVAAGSVVTRSFPPHSLIAGVPAKIVRSNVKWE